MFPFMPEWWGDTSLTPTQAAYAGSRRSAVGGADIIDYTFLQLLWDDSPNCTTCPFGGGPAKFNNMFYQPQFGALSAFSTIAHSNYNSLQLSVRQRLRDDVTFDFNYTYGHSLDNVSGLQNSEQLRHGVHRQCVVPGSELRQLRISMPVTSSMPTGWSDFRLVVVSGSSATRVA